MKNIEIVRESGNLKNKKGITLIALVVTIIVLLILAGVSIATITGENGLLEKARIAKEETDKAVNNDEENLDRYQNVIDETITGSDRSNDNLYQKLRSNNYEEVSFVHGGTYTAPCDGYYCLAVMTRGVKSSYLNYVVHYDSNGTLISYITGTGYDWLAGGCEIYLKKGEYVKFNRENGDVYSSKFFYAVGCQPDSE